MTESKEPVAQPAPDPAPDEPPPAGTGEPVTEPAATPEPFVYPDIGYTEIREGVDPTYGARIVREANSEAERKAAR